MFYNSHIHTFTNADVPMKFLPLGLVRILASRNGFKTISKGLNWLNPFSDQDIFDRYARFINIGKLGSQKAIFKECMRFYPADTRFCILSMDLSYMAAGKVSRPFEDQLMELSDLRKSYPQVIPFMHIDPRRPGVLKLLIKGVEEWGFKGIKIYPPLGYFPYDERLYPAYKYCEQKGLPVISHCSPFNPVHFRGSKNDLKEILSRSKTQIDFKGTNKELCANFANPKNWEYVLNDFGNLKICLAHFGSAHYWDKYLENPDDSENWFVMIKEMLPRYRNLYTDISFTMNNAKYFPLLKVLLADKALQNKVLFGSDYYMVETETTERQFSLDLRAFLGEENFERIASINPGHFFEVVPDKQEI